SVTARIATGAGGADVVLGVAALAVLVAAAGLHSPLLGLVSLVALVRVPALSPLGFAGQSGPGLTVGGLAAVGNRFALPGGASPPENRFTAATPKPHAAPGRSAAARRRTTPR